MEDLMEEPLLPKKQVITVRDRDYIEIEQLSDKVFVYDGCCLETMILSNSDIAEGFHREFYKGKLEKLCYLINVMRQLAPYSVLRRKNDLEKTGINFEKVGFGDLVKEDGLRGERLFERVHQSEKLCLCREQANEIVDTELWNVTNGHDFYTYLGVMSRLGKKTLGEDGVRNVLFAMYRKKDFETTKLYHAILEYQKRNGLKFVSV